MREVLEQLARIPGVVGALAAGSHGELLAAAFPPVYDLSALQQVAGMLAAEGGGLRGLAGREGALDLRYTRGRILAKPFDRGTVLVLGTPAVDAGLLALSLEQAARRLDAEAPGPAREAVPPFPSPAPAPVPVPAPAAAAAIPADVAALRAPLQDVLVRYIGPIGELVLVEAWGAWVTSGPPTRARFGRLVDVLAAEVDDPAERKDFVAAAQALVK